MLSISGSNASFGLVRLPYGWGMILVSLLIIVMVMTSAANACSTQTA